MNTKRNLALENLDRREMLSADGLGIGADLGGDASQLLTDINDTLYGQKAALVADQAAETVASSYVAVMTQPYFAVKSDGPADDVLETEASSIESTLSPDAVDKAFANNFNIGMPPQFNMGMPPHDVTENHGTWPYIAQIPPLDLGFMDNLDVTENDY